MIPIILALLWLQQPLLLEKPVTITVGPDPAQLIYSSAGDETITVTARDLTDENNLDILIEVRQDGERIAYHDVDDAPALENLLLSLPGDYSILVHTFNGVQTGAVEVLLTMQPQLTVCESGEYNLIVHTAYACLLELEAGQTLTLSVRDTSGTLDPVMRLYGPDDDLLAFNDDHATFSTTLNVFDSALIDYEVTLTSSYRLQVSDFSGAAGTFELSLDHAG